MLAFCILSFGALAAFLYVVIFSLECIWKGLDVITKKGRDYIDDRGNINAGKPSKIKDKGGKKPIKSIGSDRS